MASESELRQEVADERQQLTNAVADLRVELDHAAERGKKIGVAVGAVAATVVAVRTALRVRRFFRN
jgi:hypothetical protein